MVNDRVHSDGTYAMRRILVTSVVLVILHILQFPEKILVESLSIQPRALIHSPVSTPIATSLKLSSVSGRDSSAERCRPGRISKTIASRSVFLSPLYASSSDEASRSATANTTIFRCDDNRESHTEDGSSITTNGGVLPSYKKLIVFTATTILIWLSEPLLSLVDTTIVGLTASVKSAVVQIAALGPATTLFDSLIYTTYFLAIATTNQLAPGLAAAAAAESSMSSEGMSSDSTNSGKSSKSNPWRELRKSTSHLLGLAMVFGSVVTAITFAFGKSIIGQMVGGSANMGVAEAGAIIPLATNYAMIRAAVAPFSIVGFVAQSFCLTTLDIATPAIAVAAASIVNIIGDLALSPKYGIQGAAVATALATVTSCAILLRKVRATTNQWRQKQEKLEQSTANPIAAETNATTTETMTSIEPLESNESSTGSKDEITKNSNQHIPFCSIPDKKSMINLFRLAGPIFFVMMAKVACYNVMTIKATAFGIVPLASHNIMMRIFFFFACFGDSLSQAAQSFYPQVDEKDRGKLIQRLFFIASFVGLSNNQVSQLILKKFGRFLAKDSNIIGMMAEHAPWVGFAVLLHPFIMLLEGTVLAKRDLVFMVGTYTLTSLMHLSFVFSPVSSTFRGLWRALFGFQFIRLVQFALRVWHQSRTTTAKNAHSFATGTITTEQDGIPAPPL